MKKYDKGFATSAAHYRVARRNAEKRNIKFIISFIDFVKLIVEPCKYCGFKGRRRNIFLTKFGKVRGTKRIFIQSTINNAWLRVNGIDRVHNKKGYTKSNLVSCCETCNRAKSSLSLAEWKQYIKRLVDYNGG